MWRNIYQVELRTRDSIQVGHFKIPHFECFIMAFHEISTPLFALLESLAQASTSRKWNSLNGSPWGILVNLYLKSCLRTHHYIDISKLLLKNWDVSYHQEPIILIEWRIYEKSRSYWRISPHTFLVFLSMRADSFLFSELSVEVFK
jgi:hypothetical protein